GVSGSHATKACIDGDKLTGPHAAASDTEWQLRQRGWLLTTGGRSITLTTTERAFILTLFEAPGRQADYTTLLVSVHAGASSRADPGDIRRLAVIVSRMRNKFSKHGVTLPI